MNRKRQLRVDYCRSRQAQIGQQEQDSWRELEDELTAIRLAGLWEPHEIKYSGFVAGLKTQEPSRLFVSIAIR